VTAKAATNLSTLEAEERWRLRQLYPTPFNRLLGSALSGAEREAAERRVQLALERAVR